MAKTIVCNKDDAMIIGEGEGKIIATLGNIQVFTDTEKETRKTGVLLRDIHDEENTFQVDKEWFYQKAFINLAKKNIGRQVSFNAEYTKIVSRNGNRIKLYCVWKHITDVELVK